MSTDLTRARERVIHEHMAAEERHDVDGLMATFRNGHGKYVFPALDLTVEGKEELGNLFLRNRVAFPDLRVDILTLRHAEDAVIIEARMTATHAGVWSGAMWGRNVVAEPTGRAVEMASVLIFNFEGDELLAETVYYDSASIPRALGLGR
jgi:ketosteroid isomerase-like protein